MSAPVVSQDPSGHVGQTVTLIGTARNAHSGAVVLLDDGSAIYIDGKNRWEKPWNQKRIEATGRLDREKLAPDPEVNEQGEVSHGMKGTALVLRDATWKEAS
jgi:hypothetical protein